MVDSVFFPLSIDVGGEGCDEGFCVRSSPKEGSRRALVSLSHCRASDGESAWGCGRAPSDLKWSRRGGLGVG